LIIKKCILCYFDSTATAGETVGDSALKNIDNREVIAGLQAVKMLT
jgi:hypothetical protein